MLFLELSTGSRDIVANAVLICWLRERFRMRANKREVGVRARSWDSILALLPHVRGFCSKGLCSRAPGLVSVDSILGLPKRKALRDHGLQQGQSSSFNMRAPRRCWMAPASDVGFSGEPARRRWSEQRSSLHFSFILLWLRSSAIGRT